MTLFFLNHAALGLQSIITHLHTATSDSDLVTLLNNWEKQRMCDQEMMESTEGFNPEDPQDVFDHLMAKVRCFNRLSIVNKSFCGKQGIF